MAMTSLSALDLCSGVPARTLEAWVVCVVVCVDSPDKNIRVFNGRQFGQQLAG